MNGQPPPPPPSSPVPPTPPAQPAPVYYPPPRSGMGCFATGCLITLIAGFVLVAVLGVGGWWFYKKTFNSLTSSGPSDVRIEAPSPEVVQKAEGSKARLDQAIARNEETTIEFTGPELAVLLSRDPDLDFLRDRTRIDIADSIMTVTLSAPLRALKWPGMRDRWFNGTVRFGMTYANDEFEVDIQSAEANGREFPDVFVSGFNNSFTEAMNEAFNETRRRERNEFWNHVKTMKLEGDKLVVTTKPN